MVRPKGGVIQCNLSPKAAHMGDGDPAKSKLRRGHSVGDGPISVISVISVGICRVGICVEGEDHGEYLR
jgi:hypothetical protein